MGPLSSDAQTIKGGISTTSRGLSNNNPVNEVINFAGFLSDYDPSLVFVLTHDKLSNVSYLKVLKIVRRDEAAERSVSFAETAGKDVLIQSIKTNIIESGAQKRELLSNDNYQVIVDPSKE